MFGIGFLELALILIVALVVIGPQQLPEAARGLGKAVRQLKRGYNDLKKSLEDDDEDKPS
tara:strand:- start:125 stop:304 length:180 start_codon:yes stop_codon:yes gene_type:complete